MSADEFFSDSEEEEVSEADETCPECKKKPCVCEKDEEEDILIVKVKKCFYNFGRKMANSNVSNGLKLLILHFLWFII